MLWDPKKSDMKGFPWKQLSDHIKIETGKPFGATTVKKKWMELSAGQEDDCDYDDDNEEDEDESYDYDATRD